MSLNGEVGSGCVCALNLLVLLLLLLQFVKICSQDCSTCSFLDRQHLKS